MPIVLQSAGPDWLRHSQHAVWSNSHINRDKNQFSVCLQSRYYTSARMVNTVKLRLPIRRQRRLDTILRSAWSEPKPNPLSAKNICSIAKMCEKNAFLHKKTIIFFVRVFWFQKINPYFQNPWPVTDHFQQQGSDPVHRTGFANIRENLCLTRPTPYLSLNSPPPSPLHNTFCLIPIPPPHSVEDF